MSTVHVHDHIKIAFRTSGTVTVRSTLSRTFSATHLNSCSIRSNLFQSVSRSNSKFQEVSMKSNLECRLSTVLSKDRSLPNRAYRLESKRDRSTKFWQSNPHSKCPECCPHFEWSPYVPDAMARRSAVTGQRIAECPIAKKRADSIHPPESEVRFGMGSKPSV